MSYGIYGYGGKTTKTGALRPIDQLLVEGGRRRGCFHPPYIPWLAVARLRVKFMKKFNPCQGDSCPARESRQGGCQRSHNTIQHLPVQIYPNMRKPQLSLPPRGTKFQVYMPMRCNSTRWPRRNTKHKALATVLSYILLFNTVQFQSFDSSSLTVLLQKGTHTITPTLGPLYKHKYTRTFMHTYAHANASSLPENLRNSQCPQFPLHSSIPPTQTPAPRYMIDDTVAVFLVPNHTIGTPGFSAARPVLVLP